MAVDDSYTKALLHMDGANGSTTFTDESGKTWNAGGNSQISTANFKFTASGLFDGNGDYLSTTASADFDLGTADWTIDCWLYRNGYLSQYPGIFGASTDSNTGYYFGLNQSDHRFRIVWSNTVKILSTNPLADTTWTHIALVRNVNTVTLYVNGTADGSADCTGINFASSGDGAVIGRICTGLDGYYWIGNIDEFRLSKGIARWTGPFTPPSAPYAPAASDNIIYGATLLTEITPPSAGRISGAMMLVEMTDMPNPFGIIPTTLQSRSTAATLLTKRKTYATLNERSTALTLEERP